MGVFFVDISTVYDDEPAPRRKGFFIIRG